MGKRELVALLFLSYRCLIIVVWLILAVPWVCLQFVIVIFPDHTQLLFLRISDAVKVLKFEHQLLAKKDKQCRPRSDYL